MHALDAAEHYHTFILFSYALYLVIFGVLVSVRSAGAGLRLPLSFVAISLIALALLRLPAIFPNVAFDPDEAQYIAAAIKLKSSMNSWASVDINSSGPLNAYSLMWPFAFGLDPGFGLAHVTALLLLAATWLVVMFALTWAPQDVRIFLGGAMILLMGGTGSAPLSLLAFSSELVPSFLLMIAASIALAAAGRRPSLVRICFAGFCLGAVPFSKLQGVVVALTIGLILVVQAFRSQTKPWRAVLLLVIAACLPGALILGPLAAAGGLSDFWTSYIVSGAVYSQGGFAKVSSPGQLPPQITALYKMILPREIKYFVLSVSVGTAACVALLLWRRWNAGEGVLRDRLARPEYVRCLIAGLILLSGVAAAAAPARPFPHYAYFFLWPAILFAGSVWSLARSTRLGLPFVRAPLTSALGALVVAATAIGATAQPRVALHRAEKLSDLAAVFRPVELLPQVNGERGSLFVWGWMPELYAWSGRSQATRESLTYFQIWPSSLQEYYRRRMMGELRKDPPDYIIDAVGAGNFNFEDADKEGIGSFDQLAQFLAENYTPVGRPISGTSCPRIYASHAATAAFEKRFVPPIGVSFSTGTDAKDAAPNGEFFEACFDTSSLTSGQSGTITLDLGRPQQISGIEFLNLPRTLASLGGEQANQEPLRARVRAFAKDAVAMETPVTVPPYPRWVTAEATRSVFSDKIVIDVEGGSGGFIWIRVRR